MPNLPSTDDLRGLWDAVRDGGLVGAMAGPERKAVLDRLQATMAMIEGHAEHVMDAAGAPVLPSLPELRAALETPPRREAPAGQALEKLLGHGPQDEAVRGRQALLRRRRARLRASRA